MGEHNVSAPCTSGQCFSNCLLWLASMLLLIFFLRITTIFDDFCLSKITIILSYAIDLTSHGKRYTPRKLSTALCTIFVKLKTLKSFKFNGRLG